MKKTRLLSFLLSIILCVGIFPLKCFAETSPAYTKLLAQEPVYIKNVTFDGLREFYISSSTDEILNVKENNFIKDIVSVNKTPVECYVYMRTFNITDADGMLLADARQKAEEAYNSVKEAISFKYLKCITRSYGIRIVSTPYGDGKTQKSLVIKLMIATGESNEERAKVVEDFVRPQVETWASLSEKDRFISLNEFLLNGQFSYDMGLVNRSSVYAFINDKKGVCEEFAGITSLFLDEMGYENGLIMGHVGTTLHIWNTVVVNGRRYHIDILHNSLMNEDGTFSGSVREHLLVDTSKMLQSRTIEARYNSICKQAVYNYAFENTPTEITIPDIFSKNGDVLSHVSLFTTVEAFKSLLGNKEFLEMTDINGNPLADEAYVGSGNRLFLNVNGKRLQRFTVQVDGDVDGDGVATEKDLDIVSDAILRTGRLTDEEMLFCDITFDGKVTISDYLAIRRLSEASDIFQDIV